MESVQQIIKNLILEVGNSKIRDNSYRLLSQGMVDYLKAPLGLSRGMIKFYLPTGRYGGFEPVSVELEVTPETTTWQLLESIKSFYTEHVTKETIRRT